MPERRNSDVPFDDRENPVNTMNRPAVQGSMASAPPQAIRVSNKWTAHALTFLMVFGPGLIVMEADNDAGAVSTYVQAGAQYSKHLLWLLLLLLPICYFIQEMVVRLGIATGQGHAAMIYRRFGKWWGRFFNRRSASPQLSDAGYRICRNHAGSG